jgi:hypothetical protein
MQETECLAWLTAMKALYQGPNTMGLPITSAICCFWVAVSIAWLHQGSTNEKSLSYT